MSRKRRFFASPGVYKYTTITDRWNIIVWSTYTLGTSHAGFPHHRMATAECKTGSNPFVSDLPSALQRSTSNSM